jgi:UDPglucose--hexose-1-phosphate uridylyltransferase
VADFEFLQNKVNGKWVISAPHRSHRTNASGKTTPICPFCPGREADEDELYRTGGRVGDDQWQIRVISNKFPFAPNHEVIIHSPDHHKSLDELPMSQVELILQTYRQRFDTHKKDGQVYILHNSGSQAGASLTHPHSQLVVIPRNVKMDITPLDPTIYRGLKNPNIKIRNPKQIQNTNNKNSKRFENSNLENSDIVSSFDIRATGLLETEHFLMFCPATSEWPDEIWLAPKQSGGGFGFIKDKEITDLSFALVRLIQIFDLRHGSEFPFNFYIPPLKNWYLRLIPRIKILGGFELGTNIIVNTQDPSETFNFVKEHFWKPDHEKIKREHQAEYRKRV